MPVGKGSIQRAVKANSEGTAKPVTKPAEPVAKPAEQVEVKPVEKKTVAKPVTKKTAAKVEVKETVVKPSAKIIAKLGEDLPYYLL